LRGEGEGVHDDPPGRGKLAETNITLKDLTFYYYDFSIDCITIFSKILKLH